MLLALFFGWLGGQPTRFGWTAHLLFVPVAIVSAVVLSVLFIPRPPPGEEGFVGDGLVAVVSLTCWFFVAMIMIPSYYIRLWARWSARRRRGTPLPTLNLITMT